MEDPFVDSDYYDFQFYGLPVSARDFRRFESAAQDEINAICGGFFDTHTMADLAMQTDEERVKRAICAQIEFYQDQGGVTANERAKTHDAAKSFTVGSFSLTRPTTGSDTSVAPDGAIDPRVFRYLQPTGLLYRGVGQHGRY